MKKLIIVLAGLAASCSQSPTAPTITVSDVWTREIAPGQDMGAVYFTLSNDGDTQDTLTAINVSVAAKTDVHETKTVDGVSRMVPVGSVDVPAHGTISFKPGSIHAMVSGFTVPLKAGDRFFVDLTFAKSGKKTASGKVVSAGER